MQVTHSHDHVTHAVIGQKKTVDFGITDNPEFFQILSSTLYKDQILAVVREVICNAWDAHIESGRTETPIKVTVTNEHFIVQDFGHGIPDDMMGPIYGTYGNSTKKNDDKQTGGFGLGCKSPFAYTDHFEVISCNAGTKTIYSLSRSSASVGGKPGISTIVSMPTTETGLTVKIRIKGHDARRFEEVAHGIMRNGSMNALLNDKPVSPLQLGTEPGSWVVLDDTQFFHRRAEKLFIRYGNVVYPIENEGTFYDSTQAIRTFLHKLRHRNYKLIIQAPPHSISVTPSRESLSMQEKTIDSLGKLFGAFRAQMDQVVEDHSKVIVQDAIAEAVKAKNLAGLCFNLTRLPTAKSLRPTDVGLAFHKIEAVVDTVIRRYSYGEISGLQKYDEKLRLKAMEDSKLIERGLLQSYKKVRGLRLSGQYWFQQRFVKKLARDLQGILGGGIRKVWVVNPDDWRNGRGTTTRIDLVEPRGIDRALPLMRKLVFFAASRAQAMNLGMDYPEMKRLGNMEGAFIYLVPSTKERRNEAKQVFQKHGYHIVDLTEEADWLPKQIIAETAPKPRKTIKGYPVLKTLFPNGRVTAPESWPKDAPHAVNAEFYVMVRKRRGNHGDHYIDDVNHDLIFPLITEFGDKGVVVTNSSQEEVMTKKGAVKAMEWLVRHLVQEVSSNPRIMIYYTNNLRRSLTNRTDYTNRDKLEFFASYPPIMAHYGLQDPRTLEDKAMTALWEKLIAHRTNWSHELPGVKHDDCPVMGLLKKIEESKSQGVKDAMFNFFENEHLRILDFNELLKKLVHAPHRLSAAEKVFYEDLVMGLIKKV